MLAQFQARYPTGSLNSELLTIYQGKFIVRVSVQVEGVTRSTGMAAAETLEVAEDRARSRALMVLGIQSETRLLPHSLSDTTTEEQTQRGETIFASVPAQQIQLPSAAATSSDDRNYGFSPNTPFIEASTPAPASLEPDDRSLTATPIAKPVSEPQSAVGNLDLLADSQAGTSEETPIVPLSVTSLFSPNYEPQANADVLVGAKTGVSTDEPIDLSDAIARTTVELKRLGWTNKQGRDYLERTYGVRSRQQLDNEQMLEFLHHLESQPSPSK